MALQILLVDDDADSLDLLYRTLPKELGGESLRWEPCGSFEDAIEIVKVRRFDLIVTDVYRDSSSDQKEPASGDARAGVVVDLIRGDRFSPVLLFTDGTFPIEFEETPFVKMADKSSGNDDIIAKLEQLIATGIPSLARALHDDLDRAGGSYLWGFIEEHWASLQGSGLTEVETLERIIRRRASTQLGLLEAYSGDEIERVDGAEFYLFPPLSNQLRLGSILVDDDCQYRVVLTPHCHLVVQPQEAHPRASYVLTALTRDARGVLRDFPFSGDRNSWTGQLRRKIQSPPDVGRPKGRFWFLPGIGEMSHRYIDFLQVDSLPLVEIQAQHKIFAVLDSPFAEAMQSCFLGLYSSVGVPNIDVEKFEDLSSTWEEYEE